MNYTEDKYNQAKSDMLSMFKKAILDAESEPAAGKRPDEEPENSGVAPTDAIQTEEQP
jgi:hypothetical protein